MSQAVLALHCPNKEDYLTALKYTQSHHPDCRWHGVDGLNPVKDWEVIVYDMVHFYQENLEDLCVILSQNEEGTTLNWGNIEYCRKEGYMIIPAVNFRTDQSTIPSRMCQEDVEKGESK